MAPEKLEEIGILVSYPVIISGLHDSNPLNGNLIARLIYVNLVANDLIRIATCLYFGLFLFLLAG